MSRTFALLRPRGPRRPAGGGQDTGATPTELLVAVRAFYADRYLLRHGLDRSGLAVTASFAMADDRPARVRDVRL
jgi:putative redox protein